MAAAPEAALAQKALGIDVSHWQGTAINWTSVKNGGISFAWTKATEGTGYTDDTFLINEANAKAAGVPIGAYHYARYDGNTGTAGATAEANWYWSVAKNYIKGGGAYLVPMLDVEASNAGYTAAQLSAWVNQWCTTVVSNAAFVGVTVKPVIYLSACHANWVDSSTAQWHAWIANYNGQDPQTGTPWSACSGNNVWGTWELWQYTSTGSVPGTSGNTDHDVYNGSTASFLSKFLIGGGNNATFVSSSVPSGVETGKTFTASITLNNSGTTTWTNTGIKPYKLGSQTPQDNNTWGFNRVVLPSSPINPGANATFTFTATAPATAGTYVFSWKMMQEGVAWFGDTFSTYVSVVIPGPGTNYGNYTIDSGNMDSTSRNGSYVSYSTCGVTGWYSYVCNTAGTYFDRDIRWMPSQPPYGFSGRGYLTATALVPSTHATANAVFNAVDAAGTDLGGAINGTINQCAYSCTSPTVYSGAINVSSFGGFRSNTLIDGPAPSGGCSATCGVFAAGYSQMHIQAARWQYIDDWTCLGSYASSSVSDTANRAFNEANLYLYPAVDTTHGSAITTALGYNGNTPGRVTTGDCNNTNTLNFGGAANGVAPAGNAAAYGNANAADAYGFAWVFSPAGAAPKFMLGSDDGNRLWVNGVLRNDVNTSRSLTRDQDTTAAVTLPAGWNRVLFKLHNVSGTWQGTVSLRNSSNVNLNEPSVNYYDLGGYYSYGLGYEQDNWYPQIAVYNLYGSSSPTNGRVFYSNNTTVGASGVANGQGPVPYARTMQYQWGYGLGNADSNYADVSGSPTSTSWSHVITGVTGHRRLHLFAVSQSGRTSFQNSGSSGGSVYQDAGNYARYYDFFVDNVPPLSPSFSSAASASTSQIDLQWAIPLDQGVNVAPDTTETAGAGGNQDSQNWYLVGDVAVQVYRDGSVLSPWGTGTALSDNGLNPNTSYSYTVEARDNTTGLRGNWHNSTGQQGASVLWTLSVPPALDSITPSQTTPPAGSNVTWTAVSGFGPGQVQYYRYAWDTSATHAWTDTEPQWSAGTLTTVATTTGAWYLHVKGYNGADVGNGTYDYTVTATAATAATALVSSFSPAIQGSNVTFTATVSAVAPATGTPTGEVVFVANGTPFSTNGLVSGSASASTASLPLGTNTVAAQYGGDLFFLGSSDSLQQVVQAPSPCSETNSIVGIADNHDGTFVLTFAGTAQAQYYVVATSDIAAAASWSPLSGSTNTVTAPSGVWTCTVTNTGSPQFYRSVAITPCP